MFKKLKERTMSFLDNISLNRVSNFEDYCYLLEYYSLSIDKINLLKVLKLIHTMQTKEGDFILNGLNFSPVQYLKSVSLFLDQNKDKLILKNNIKYIRKSIEFIDSKFDDHYLLYENHESNPYFDLKENLLLLSFCDILSDILNIFDYNKEADTLFMIKGRLELGIQRYFFHLDNKCFVSNFSQNNKDYTLIGLNEDYEILTLTLDTNLILEKQVKLISKKKEEISNVNNYLNWLLLIKKLKDSSWRKNVSKYEKEFYLFPQSIFSNKEFFKIDVQRSLFGKSSIEEEKSVIVKDKLLLENVDSIKIAFKIFRLLYDE